MIYFSDFESGGASSFTLTIASGEVASNLTNFPVYVDLADLPAGFWSAVTSDGGNIRISQSGTDLAFDVMAIDTGAETGAVFFKAPTLNSGSNNVFTIEARSAATMPAVGNAIGRNAVWSDYETVQVFPSSTLVNRTGKSTTITARGTVDFNQAIAMCPGGAAQFNADADSIWESGLTSSNVFTMACTVRSTVYTTANQAAMSYNVGEGSGNRQTMAFQGSAGINRHGVWDTSNGWQTGGTAPVALTAYRLATTYDGTNPRRVYKDGAEIGNDPSTSAMSGTKTGLNIGNGTQNSGEGHDGQIGFVYLRLSALSANWLAAEYSNLSAPSSFYTIT